MRRIFTALTLLLVACSAFADGSGAVAQAHHFAEHLAPPETDYSVGYLSQIFGTVGNTLEGSSGQILGKMFDIFNKGVLVVAALWLGYSSVSISLHAAGEGTFSSPNRSIHWILLRIALGFALIIPSSTTGYSLLQDVFMKIVVEGVGLADQTWDAALKYLKYGGSLYIPPTTMSTTTDMVNKAIGSSSPSGAQSNNLAPVTQIFQDEVCMYASEKSWQEKHNQSLDTMPSSSYGDFHPYFTPPQQLPGVATVTPGGVSFPGWGDPESMLGTSCGWAIAYHTAVSPEDTVATGQFSRSNQDQLMLTQYSYAALKQLVLSLLPAAREYVRASDASNPYNNTSNKLNLTNIVPPAAGSSDFLCPYTSSSMTSACPIGEDSSLCTNACDLLNNNSKTVFAALVGYGNLITPYQKLLMSGQGHDKFMKKARAEGWIMAGAFYWKLEQENAGAAKISVSALLPEVHGPNAAVMTAGTSMATFLNIAAGDIQNYQKVLKYYWAQYVGAQQNASSASGTQSPTTSGFANEMASNSLSILTGTNLSSEQAYNPIVTLMQFGTKLLDAVVAIWIAAIALSVIIASGMGVCTAVSPTGVIFQAIITWLKSIMMILTAALLVPGCILAYYVPMYPFAVYTFAAVGWILMVIEGMAAAPLVCLGVTHPEGHDFLGKAEQALMLFLSIFLRPALMVIGLVAAMIVSFVAFRMLTSGFSTILTSLMQKGGGAYNFHSASGGFVVLISFCMVWVIFGMMTMELIEQCYKLIYQLPNYILKWIGGPQTGEEYGQMAQGIKGAVSTGASQMGGAMTKPVDESQGRAQGLQDSKRNMPKPGSANINVTPDGKGGDAGDKGGDAGGAGGGTPSGGGTSPLGS